MSRKVGRRPKLTPNLQLKICNALRASSYRSIAAQAVGIGVSTLYHWLDLGRQDGSPRIYREFLEAVEAAEAESEMTLAANVTSAAKKDWRAAAFILERKFPKRWGKKDEVTSTSQGPGGGPVVTKTIVEFGGRYKPDGEKKKTGTED